MIKHLVLAIQAISTLAIGFIFIIIPNGQGDIANFLTNFIGVFLLSIGIAGTAGTYLKSKIGFYFSLQLQYFCLTILIIVLAISLNNFRVGLTTSIVAMLIIYTIVVLNLKRFKERYGFRKNTLVPNILMSITGLTIACATLLFYNKDQTALELPVKVEFRPLGYGICETRTVYTSESNQSPSGRHTSSNNFRLIEKTSIIPSTLGISFGAEYYIASDTPGYINVEQVWRFPQAIIDKEGQEFSESRYMIDKPLNDTTYSVYTMEEEFEIVKGEWTYQMYYQGDLLYEQKFDIK